MLTEFLGDRYVLFKNTKGEPVSLTRGERQIHLTDSPLHIVDLKAYRGQLIGILEKLAESMRLEKVMDLAGGKASETIIDIVHNFPNINEAINIDWVADRSLKSNCINPIPANVLEMTAKVPRDSIDCALSSHLFQYFADTDDDFYHQVYIFKGLEKTIRPRGGIAIIHEDVEVFKEYSPKIGSAPDIFYGGFDTDFIVMSRGLPLKDHPALAHLKLAKIS